MTLVQITNKDKKKVAVIIPIYKLEPDNNEKKSLEQCLKVLNTRSIIFFCGHSFDSSFYSLICKKCNITFIKRSFKDKYFKSKKDYNHLCLTKKFYSAFSEYEFILIYQLDAWIFSDQLDYWCSLNYDFIGAPFPENINAEVDCVNFTTVGNGGFSLRKVKPIIYLLNKEYYRLKNWQSLLNSYRERISRNPLWYLYCILRVIGYKNNIKYIKKNYMEDLFFSEVSRLTSLIKLPDPYTALKFSFEYRPSIAYKLNGMNLPMGCHGWTWIEYNEFWKKFIT